MPVTIYTSINGPGVLNINADPTDNLDKYRCKKRHTWHNASAPLFAGIRFRRTGIATLRWEGAFAV
jgi:hypothetical protein